MEEKISKRYVIVAVVACVLVVASVFYFNSKKEDKMEDSSKTEIKKDTTSTDESTKDDESEQADDSNLQNEQKLSAIVEETKKEAVELKDAVVEKIVEVSEPVVNKVVEVINDNSVKDVVNDYYEEALVAVNDALEKVDVESYNIALEKVSKLADKERQELTEKLGEVSNNLNIVNIIDDLKKKLEMATDIDAIDSLRTLRNTSNVDEALNNLSEGAFKDKIVARIEELDKVLFDDVAPVINIEDNAILDSYTTPVISDDNDYSVKLVKDGVLVEDFTENIELTDGSYVITVTDKAFNSTTRNFVIDTLAPKFNIEDNLSFSDDVQIVIDDLTFDYVEVQNIDLGTTEKIENNEFTLEDEGVYKLKAYDKLSRVTELTITIDKSISVASIIPDNKDKFLEKVLENDKKDTLIDDSINKFDNVSNEVDFAK